MTGSDRQRGLDGRKTQTNVAVICFVLIRDSKCLERRLKPIQRAQKARLCLPELLHGKQLHPSSFSSKFWAKVCHELPENKRLIVDTRKRTFRWSRRRMQMPENGRLEASKREANELTVNGKT
ncbi:hypothetical protein L596_012664 [Steinernema carpocapsae]|uniref:Uncharacterized protein n=1 Tax=Steinernema carpocapsae TaxID=34508 RepID=A0A4U5NYJ6_STECR|nr:hypothetical protein L596_012664 [Steinernema carpocapsae]